jgi:hypothetical protein
MSAKTTWYVKVLIPTEKWVDVQAVTSDEARIEARIDYPETFMVLQVKHWKEMEEHETRHH